MSDQDSNTTLSSEPRSQASPLGRADSGRIRNNLMYKLGVEAERPTMMQGLRTEDTLLGNVRIIREPLKDSEDRNASNDKAVTGLWIFSSLFGGKTEEPRDETSPVDADTPSLSSSFSSTNMLDNNADSGTLEEESSTSNVVRKLQFKSHVEVCLIPKKEEYSKRIRGHLWNSPEEMAKNAQRNTLEFAAEGWDWRNVMEDENMYRCLATNELIHPVHIEQRSP